MRISGGPDDCENLCASCRVDLFHCGGATIPSCRGRLAGYGGYGNINRVMGELDRQHCYRWTCLARVLCIASLRPPHETHRVPYGHFLLGIFASASANWFNKSEQYLAGCQDEALRRYYKDISSEDVRRHIYSCMIAHGYAFRILRQ